MTYIYVASSWRNAVQPEVVSRIRAAGLECYDFRQPTRGDFGFRWSEVLGDDWKSATSAEFRAGLEHPVAREGFAKDSAAMHLADTLVLVLPCGRSAHLELGWGAGRGKRTAVLLDEKPEPELMYRFVDFLAVSTEELVDWLSR